MHGEEGGVPLQLHAAEVIRDLRRARLSRMETWWSAVPRADATAKTVTISPEELSQIRQGSRNRRAEEENQPEIGRKVVPEGSPSEEEPSGEPEESLPEAHRKKTAPAGERRASPENEDVESPAGTAAHRPGNFRGGDLCGGAVILVLVRVGGTLYLGSGGRESQSLRGEHGGDRGDRMEKRTETTWSQKEVKMPKLVGDTQEEAEAKLDALDLTMQVVMKNSDTVEKGVVMEQADAPDSVVSRYSKVVVTISSGSDKILLSELGIADMTLETAVRLLEAKGLKAVVVEETSEDVEAGKIVRMEPEDKAALGDSVTLYVSTGPEVEVTPVPDLYGKTENEAAALLTEAGLLTGEISRAHDASVPAGQVISQGIEKDTDAELGTAVDLVVSLGPEPPKTQFLASLQVTYPLMISFGPGAESSEVQILIRLKQTVNGKVTYTKLAEPKAYSASTMLDIRLDHIRGADGVSTGEVEIVDLTNNVVLTSYNVNFVETEV